MLTRELDEIKKALPAPKEAETPPVPALRETLPKIPDDLPLGVPVVGQKGMVFSPYAPERGRVDAVGLKRGTRIKCPFTGKHFRVP
jgi:hypothetical protein